MIRAHLESTHLLALLFLVLFGPVTVHGILYAACLDSYSSTVKGSHSGGEGATLPSTLQGISVKQGIADVSPSERLRVPSFFAMQDQRRSRIGIKNRGNAVFFSF